MTSDPDDPTPSSQAEAQQRVSQVSAFTRELAELDRAGVLKLAPADRDRLGAYHAGLLDRLARRFDVDRSERQRQMSLGMRIASLLGAVTLSAAVVLFFYRVWGLLAIPAQLGVLAAAPLLLLAAVAAAARREKTLYVASILAVVATVAFILDINVVGVIFNMRPSPYALALWSAFAFIVAYTYGLRLLLGAGIVMAMACLCMIAAMTAGLDPAVFIGRPEPLLPAGALALGAAFLAPNRRRQGFPETWRLAGSIAILVPLIFLSTWSGVFSYVPWPENVLGPIYDVLAIALAGAGIWIGIRAGWREVVNVASAVLVVFLYAKCFEWWWNWMPRYLFFLMLGGLAVAALFVLGRIRSGQRKV